MSCTGCGSGGGNLIPVFSDLNQNQQKDVIVIEGPGINVEDLSDAETYRYRVSREEYLSLSVTLSLTAEESGVIQTFPVLKGTVLDKIILNWVYNKVIASQTLLNTGGLTPPVLLAADVTKTYDPTAITTGMSFTVQGNDGNGQVGSVASDTVDILFANVMYIGHGADKSGTDSSLLSAFLQTLSSLPKTSRAHTFYATGGLNEYHFVAYPKSFGLGTFTKQGLPEGGYVRLKKVVTTLKKYLTDGDVETDIMITNSKGFSEAYYVYESADQGIGDVSTPIFLT